MSESNLSLKPSSCVPPISRLVQRWRVAFSGVNDGLIGNASPCCVYGKNKDWRSLLLVVPLVVDMLLFSSRRYCIFNHGVVNGLCHLIASNYKQYRQSLWSPTRINTC